MDTKAKLQYNEEHDWKEVVETLLYLRSEQGCPWDQLQTTESIITNLIEEVSEFIDALHRYKRRTAENTETRKKELIEECGDVQLVLIMMMIILQEEDDTILGSTFKNLKEKLIRRHPHVNFNEHFNRQGEKSSQAPQAPSQASQASLYQQWHDIKYHLEGKREPEKLSDYKPYLHILERTKELQKRMEKTVVSKIKISSSSNIEKKSKKQALEDVSAAVASLEKHFDLIPEDKKEPSPDSTTLAVGKALYDLVNLSRSLRVSPTTALSAYVSTVLEEHNS